MLIIFSRGVIVLKKKDKIEAARNILNNAANMNMDKRILLKISQKIDEYIVEFYRKGEGQKSGLGDEGENT